MAQQVGALALAEIRSVVPCTYMVAHNLLLTLVPRDLTLSSDLGQALDTAHMWCIYGHEGKTLIQINSFYLNNRQLKRPYELLSLKRAYWTGYGGACL